MGASESITASRPVVTVDGAQASTLTGGLLRMSVSEDVRGLSHGELEFGNWGPQGASPGFLFFDRTVIDFGKRLEVEVAGAKLFSGRITAIEARFPAGDVPSLVVLAEDMFQGLRMTRRTRTFADRSDAEVFAEIAREHGLTPDVSIDGPVHKVLGQVNQSDLAFMRERARALDAELWVNDSTLSVKRRSSRGSAPVTLTYGQGLRELRVIADLADQATNVAVNGWDVAGKSVLREEADASLLSGELAGGDSGASVLQAAFGERNDAMVGTIPLTSAEARARVEAVFRRRARRFVVGHGTADTLPDLRVGATLRLAGLGPLFAGDFYLAAVTHVFDDSQGLRSDLELERAGLGRP